jgi:hypothetical protein
MGERIISPRVVDAHGHDYLVVMKKFIQTLSDMNALVRFLK